MLGHGSVAVIVAVIMIMVEARLHELIAESIYKIWLLVRIKYGGVLTQL